MNDVVVVNVFYFNSFRIIKGPVNFVCCGVDLYVTVVFLAGKHNDSIALYDFPLVKRHPMLPCELQGVIGIFAFYKVLTVSLFWFLNSNMCALLRTIGYFDMLLPCRTIVSPMILNSTGLLVESG